MIDVLNKIHRAINRAHRVLAKAKPAHPIDRKYGIETTSILTPRQVAAGGELDIHNVGYVGAQPSVVKKCLDLLPIDKSTAFIDLGCGKGRVLAVASEYLFGQVIGIEFSQRVFDIARKNVEAIKRKRPASPITLIKGDATVFDGPAASKIVLFLYNSFDRPLVEKLLTHLEVDLARRAKVFLIYYNPVHFDVFDESRSFTRFFAEKIAFDEDERASAPFDNMFDSVVMYQNRREPILPAKPGAEAMIRVTVPRLGAEVVSST